MKTHYITITLSTLVFSASFVANAKIYKREDNTCFPITQEKYEVGTKSFNTMSESDFNKVVDNVTSAMTLEIKRRLNKDLIVERKWSDSTVDAFATRDEVNNPVIVINGGLARHPYMTKDGLALLICHEVGHHLGGAPKSFRGNSGLRSWSSAEGQADYFATTKCLPYVFKGEAVSKNLESESDSAEYSAASSKCKDAICTRTVLAGLAVSKVFASLLRGSLEPSLLLNDPTSVSTTIYKHPNPQCRLDTYSSGALCDLGIEFPFDLADPKIGACLKDQGIRPSCWFNDDEFMKK